MAESSEVRPNVGLEYRIQNIEYRKRDFVFELSFFSHSIFYLLYSKFYLWPRSKKRVFCFFDIEPVSVIAFVGSTSQRFGESKKRKQSIIKCLNQRSTAIVFNNEYYGRYIQRK